MDKLIVILLLVCVVGVAAQDVPPIVDEKDSMVVWRKAVVHDQNEAIRQSTTKRITCPICGKCAPEPQDGYWVTAMYCPNDPCCNYRTQDFVCTTTDSTFTIQYGECELLEWGYWTSADTEGE